MAVAYRFLGSVSEAEDIVQETYLRWVGGPVDQVREPKAYLTRIASRLCLDHLKSARIKREQYVGPWLPEPLVESSGYTTMPEAARADDISIALMLALERLSPLERAAFVLHDTFGQTFEEVALALDRTPASCRQLAARARRHLRAERPRFAIAPGEGEAIVNEFMLALQSGNLRGLTQLLTTNAVLHSDSGGKVRSARRHILGAERIARMFASIHRRNGPGRSASVVTINGQPGLLMQDYNGLIQTLAFDFSKGSISAIYLVRNPEKLRHLNCIR